MDSAIAVLSLVHCLHTVLLLPLTVLWSLWQLVSMDSESLPNPERMAVDVHRVWVLSPMLGATLAATMAFIGVSEHGVNEEFVYILAYTLLLVPISASWLWSRRRSSPFTEASIDKVRAAHFGVSLWTVCVLGLTLVWWRNALTGF
ncbi:MAG: hypothetical protein OXL97_09330 [Chloroflexota bacterium]|nr:hypothetical protein [Chloroflexota bacterium]MDE2883892.1 hypothetical protein [Chloroflexota bacterium]MYA50442.1 hypothetical protein [Chloroflexota bacterium]